MNISTLKDEHDAGLVWQSRFWDLLPCSPRLWEDLQGEICAMELSTGHPTRRGLALDDPDRDGVGRPRWNHCGCPFQEGDRP